MDERGVFKLLPRAKGIERKERITKKKTELKTLASENAFDLIGKEWMLVTAGNKEKFNTMTASWGGIGWLWNKPVAFVFIRPECYTHDFIEREGRLSDKKKVYVETTVISDLTSRPSPLVRN